MSKLFCCWVETSGPPLAFCRQNRKVRCAGVKPRVRFSSTARLFSWNNCLCGRLARNEPQSQSSFELAKLAACGRLPKSLYRNIHFGSQGTLKMSIWQPTKQMLCLAAMANHLAIRLLESHALSEMFPDSVQDVLEAAGDISDTV